MLNKIFFKIFGILDYIKSLLLSWGIKILLVLLLCAITHNVVKMSEISSRYTGDYKKLYEVYKEDYRYMNVYSIGSGSKTVVILPAFGSQSPIMQYKTIVDSLKNNYRVVVIEYFGYGYSMSIKKDRTNENIAYEIKKVLETAEIGGPYTFVAADSSQLYAMSFQQNYPNLVNGIVVLDGVYPEEVNDYVLLKQRKSFVSNVNITSAFELSGFERVLSYFRPGEFYINEMKNMPEIYGEEELGVYRNRIGSNYLSFTMVREANKMIENMTNLVDYRYPDYLPVLHLLASDSVSNYDAYKEVGAEKTLNDMAQNLISNQYIQKVEVINGAKALQLSNPMDTINSINDFLRSY